MTKNFTITEASAITNVTVYTLRYYERIGLIDSVTRTSSGKRAYSEKDIEWIIFLSLFRDMGMPIQEMLQFADMKRRGIKGASQRKVFLERYRGELLAQIKEREAIVKLVDLKLQVLDKKIETNNQEADSMDFEQLIHWRKYI